MKRLLSKIQIVVFKWCVSYVTKYCYKKGIPYPFIKVENKKRVNIIKVQTNRVVTKHEGDRYQRDIDINKDIAKNALFEELQQHIRIDVDDSYGDLTRIDATIHIVRV